MSDALTSPTPEPRRILVVDDHPVVCDGVRSLLAGQSDLRVVGEANEQSTAVRLAGELQPDAVVLDLRMGGRFSPETSGAVKAVAPDTKVLIHTSSEENEPVHAALRAGADGAVFKDGRDLVPALRALLDSRDGYLDPRLRTGRPQRRAGVECPVVGPLSPREYDVLCALAAGRSTIEIASELYLAESTVRSYTKALLTKLGVRSRIEALAVARRAQLI
ncbi:MAG: response regulator transcription factor [Pseudonocardiales bacterium]|nr:response regulator transcription factor [Pseudonocardiales bacterium]